MKVFKFKQTDYFQILKLISQSDRIKLFLVSLIQIFLAFLDLIGVAFFGLIGSVTVAAISSTKVAGRTESVINFIGLENYTSQVQVAILGSLAAILMVIKTFASLYFNKKIIFFLSRRSAIMSANLTSNLFKKSFTDIKQQGSQKLIYSLLEKWSFYSKQLHLQKTVTLLQNLNAREFSENQEKIDLYEDFLKRSETPPMTEALEEMSSLVSKEEKDHQYNQAERDQ